MIPDVSFSIVAPWSPRQQRVSRWPPSQGATVLMNSVCNKLLKPIDGSCCQAFPPPNLLQKLAACFFLGSGLVFLLLHLLGSNHHRRPVPPDVESLEEKKPATAAAPLGPKAPFQALCRMGVIMAYFYLCDRADVFMKEQKFYSHSTFFVPLVYIFILGVFYSENSKEVSCGGWDGACEGISGNNGRDLLSSGQAPEPGANGRVEGMDAAGHPHLPHIWSQRGESSSHTRVGEP